ncbi:type II toxin-antitoxin system Phd/YefM family antitoxin [Actinomycetes bacterium M1A6_2h]
MKSITVAQLRQNPTEAIDDLERGEEYIITRHRKEVGRLVPPRKRIPVTAERAAAVYLAAPLDGSWSAEFEQDRADDVVENPWDRA